MKQMNMTQLKKEDKQVQQLMDAFEQEFCDKYHKMHYQKKSSTARKELVSFSILSTGETLYQLRSDTRPATTAHKMHLAQDRTILTIQVNNSLQR